MLEFDTIVSVRYYYVILFTEKCLILHALRVSCFYVQIFSTIVCDTIDP